MSIRENLRDASSLEDLARMLGYKPSALSYLVYKLPSAKKYKKFEIPKKSGGVREICAPIDPLKMLQRRLANILYACRDQIDAERGQRPLSHGFRRGYSIITNARCHKRKRYVLNLDLQDFFPAFNFGRVRGFFIKNHHFELNEKVGTLIAQIACHENILPQGSPCSPIIADLIAHILDVRLAQLAKKCRVTYSRYADDLTFSTNQRAFPPSLAAQGSPGGSEWILGDDLTNTIRNAGFAVNPAKTRMQFRTGRQLVTGLTVNAKVNIRSEYYRLARAMCHSLFETGAYYRPAARESTKDGAGEVASEPELVSILEPIEGILSHIHHVKNSADRRKELEKKKNPTSARKLYTHFLAYRFFVTLNRPLIICEGKTDYVYLKYAIRELTAFHPKLGAWSDTIFNSAVSFFSYTNQAHGLLDLGGGTGGLKFLFIRYKDILQTFKHRPLKHPIVVLIDNDEGAKDIFKSIKQNYGISIDIKSSDLFFHITDNLYLVKTPEQGKEGMSCIENFFNPSLLLTEIGGKKFNLKKVHGAVGEYGKAEFSDKVIRPNADKIDFSNFAPLLDRIAAVIDHYSPPAMPGAATP